MARRDVDSLEPRPVITRSRRTSNGCVAIRDTAPDAHPATKRADAFVVDDGASSREVDDGASTTRERAMTRRASRRVRDEAPRRRETTRNEAPKCVAVKRTRVTTLEIVAASLLRTQSDLELGAVRAVDDALTR